VWNDCKCWYLLISEQVGPADPQLTNISHSPDPHLTNALRCSSGSWLETRMALLTDILDWHNKEPNKSRFLDLQKLLYIVVCLHMISLFDI
jgi:hypothetical protein